MVRKRKDVAQQVSSGGLRGKVQGEPKNKKGKENNKEKGEIEVIKSQVPHLKIPYNQKW